MSRRSYIKLPIDLLDQKEIASMQDREWRKYIESIANDPDEIHWEREPLRAEWDRLRDQRTAELSKREKHRCRNCGTTQDLTVDHVKPIALGGSNELSNLQFLCVRCNSKKGSRFIG